MTIWRKRIADWIPDAINTHPEYVILIALPQQQWLHERASKLHCTYIDSFLFPVFLMLLRFQFYLFELYTSLYETHTFIPPPTKTQLYRHMAVV
jgi:hypothetical protein